MKRSLLVSLFVIGLAACGCTKNPDPAATTNNSAPGTFPAQINPDTVVGQPGTNPASGIDLRNVGPEVVVDQFLRALQQGNRDLVSALLTATARTETARFGLEVQPESVPNSAFRIVQAAYLPEQDPNVAPTMAHVASLWAEDGGEEAYEIIWVLRHETEGWRISAMGLTVDFNQDPLLLDFEHPEEMMKAREKAMEDLAKQEGADPAVAGLNEGSPDGSATADFVPVAGGQQEAYTPPGGVATRPNFPADANNQFSPIPPQNEFNGTADGSPLRQPGAYQGTQSGGVENPIRR